MFYRAVTKIMNNTDEITLHESLTGTYILKSDDGNIVCHGHNLVVNSGRKLLYNYIKNNLKELNFRFYFGKHLQSSFTTTNNTTYDDIKNSIIYNGTDSTGNTTPDDNFCYSLTDNTNIKFNDKNLSMTIQCVTTGSTASVTISEGFLTYASKDENGKQTEKLFSRFQFDPQYLTAGVEYSIEYTIHF